MRSNRDDFTDYTRDRAAKRVGYRCSFPGCGQVTVGPSEESDSSVSNIGEACHICAAAPGGRRYDPAMTPGQRKSINNCIWMCKDHGTLIDTDEVTYSVETLRQWKRDAEEAAHKAIEKRNASDVSAVYSSAELNLYHYLNERLCAMRDEHPSFMLMKRADEALFADAKEKVSMEIEAVYDKKVPEPLIDILNRSWAQHDRNHLIIEGEGGIGKTVTLLSLTTRAGNLPEQVCAIYVPMYRLDSVASDPIDTYIKKYVLTDFVHKDEYIQQLEELGESAWDNGPSLILLLDGFNEITNVQRYDIIFKLKEWLDRHPGVQVIASSRDNLRRDLAILGELHDVRLQHLTYEAIKKYLNNIKLEVPEKSNKLMSVINRPLMLTLYARTSRLADDAERDLFLQPAPYNAGKVIWNYLQSEIHHLKHQRGAGVDQLALAVIVCEFIVPSIAYDMEQEGKYIISKNDFDCAFTKAWNQFTQGMAKEKLPAHLEAYLERYEVENFKKSRAKNLLREELCIFRERKNDLDEVEYQLMHQDFRDCFAAIHLINEADCLHPSETLPEIWQHSIGHYVMSFLVNLILQEQADMVWKANCSLQTLHKIAMANQMRLQGMLRNYDYRELDFSGLDLREFSLFPYRIPDKVRLLLPSNAQKLQGTILAEKTFMAEMSFYIVDAAITPDGKRCVVGSWSGTISIWDIASGTCECILGKHTDRVSRILITTDGKRCVSSAWDGTIRVWDLDNGTCEHTLKVNCTGRAISVNITSENGKRFVISSVGNTIQMWNMQNGYLKHTLEGHTGDVRSIAVTADDNRCVSGSEDSTLRVWNLKSGKCERILKGHTNRVVSVAVASDGKKCASISADGTLRVWDMCTGICLLIHSIPYRKGSVTAGVEITHDGIHCIWFCNDLIGTLDVKTGKSLWTSKQSTGVIRSIVLTNDDKQCISFGDYEIFQMWNIDTGKSLSKLNAHKEINLYSLSRDGKRCVDISPDRTFHILNVDSRHFWIRPGCDPGRIRSLQILPNGTHSVCFMEDGSCHILDMKNKKYLFSLKDPKKQIMDIAIDQAQKHCVCAFRDGLLRVWDIKSGESRFILQGHAGCVNAIVITNDGKKCISASADKTLRIWDLETGECLKKLEGHTDDVYAVTVTNDGKKVVSASGDCTLRIWDMATSKSAFVLKGHTHCVSAIAIAKDNKTCISASLDGTLRVWDLEKKICEKTLKRSDVPEHYGTEYYSVAITDDGSHCVSVGFSYPLRDLDAPEEDRTIEKWDIQNEKCLIIASRGTYNTESIAITSDNKYCIADADGPTIKTWSLESGSCQTVFHCLGAISLQGVNFKESIIEPKEFRTTLEQNGAIV